MESNERLHSSSEIGRHSSTSTNICVDGGMDGSLLKRKLIVNYLPQTYTEFELRNLFTSLGEIESVRIMKDSKTGYSYGFGFVNFIRDEDGISAQSKMNGFELQSKRIKVSFARPPSDDNKHTNLYVTNLPRDGTEDDLLKLFKPYGTIVQSKLLTDKYTKLPRGVAFVRYETREQASNAILAMHEFMPEGQIEPIRVRLAEDHGKRRASYLAGFQAGMGILAKHHNHHHRQQTSSYRGSSKGPSAEVDNFRTRRSHCNENGGGGGKWISSSKHHHRRNSYDRGNSRSRSER